MPDVFARGSRELADNLLHFHALAADEDLYLSYAIVHPTVDRAKPAHQQPEPLLYAGVLEERDGGVGQSQRRAEGGQHWVSSRIGCSVRLDRGGGRWGRRSISAG